MHCDPRPCSASKRLGISCLFTLAQAPPKTTAERQRFFLFFFYKQSTTRFFVACKLFLLLFVPCSSQLSRVAPSSAVGLVWQLKLLTLFAQDPKLVQPAMGTIYFPLYPGSCTKRERESLCVCLVGSRPVYSGQSISRFHHVIASVLSSPFNCIDFLMCWNTFNIEQTCCRQPLSPQLKDHPAGHYTKRSLSKVIVVW